VGIYVNENKGNVFWRAKDINTGWMDWYTYGGRERNNWYGGNANPVNWFNSWQRPLNRAVGYKSDPTNLNPAASTALEIFHCPPTPPTTGATGAAATNGSARATSSTRTARRITIARPATRRARTTAWPATR
jgi:hypothetical protein